jgi:hypothetical protein
MEVYYCRGWFRARKAASEVLSEDEARDAYKMRTLHTALIGDKDRPECFVEVTGDSIAVRFLDPLLREHVSYCFSEVRPGRLFLSMAVRRGYIGKSDKVERGASFVFKEDGSAIVHREDFVAGVLERADVHIDVSLNWEDCAAFGDYSALIQRSREKNWGEVWETCLVSWSSEPS